MLEFLISCVYIESNMDECIISFVKKKNITVPVVGK
jgi:hypothetical protein